MRMVLRRETLKGSDFGNWDKGFTKEARDAEENLICYGLFQYAVVELLSAPVGRSLDEGQN